MTLSEINIDEARSYLTHKVIHTPVRRLTWLEKIIGVPVWIKLEHQQHTGSFKYRGALYALRNHPANIPVIAASAGNHGLAIAYVCKQLNIPSYICLPSNASRLKRQRVVNAGANLIEYGASLDEAIVQAKALALAREWRFISPYNDTDLISASATIAQEFITDVPDLNYMIVPIGGGGLISGMALACAALNKNIRMIGCEPENYPSMTLSLRENQAVKVTNTPTYADGLAVNIEPDCLTLPIIKKYITDIVTLNEEELAFGTFALLNKESILVEPAGCAGIAALLNIAKNYTFTGPVGIPLCGGNIQKNILNRILEQHFQKREFVELLDLRGLTLENTPIVKTYATQKQFSADISPRKESMLSVFKDQIKNLHHDLHSLSQDIKSYLEFCYKKALPIDSSLFQSLNCYLNDISEHLTTLPLLDTNTPLTKEYINLYETNIRWALQALAHGRSTAEWRAAAYDQAHATQFFDLSFQENPGVNYDRYESSEVKRLESQLFDVLNMSEGYGATVTSSGMAAYAILEAFLLRYALTTSGTILTTPYIYFEAKEQLESLKMFKLKKTTTFDAIEMIEQLKQDSSINIIFADSLANIVEQPMTDICYLIKSIGELKLARKIYLVIDGTMLSGALLSCLPTIPENIILFYYESCSKYLQLGFEMCLAGVVVYPIQYQAHFERLRRNTGSILYRQQVFSYPQFSRNVFLQRMSRISDNALQLATTLTQYECVAKQVKLFYPLLATHQHHHIAASLPYSGGCITFSFWDEGKNNNNYLEAFITKFLQYARIIEVPLVKGVSFGYNISRISAASSIAEGNYPFLRLYVGDIDHDLLVKLADALINTFKESIEDER